MDDERRPREERAVIDRADADQARRADRRRRSPLDHDPAAALEDR
jgi:hypothetical protein